MLCPPPAFGPDDVGVILGIFQVGYEGHDYEEWLLGQVATILVDDLAIGSAGLLTGGALARSPLPAPDTLLCGTDAGLSIVVDR